MATLTLERQHTALLIADFYAAFMGTLPHAVDRQVVEHTQRLQQVAREVGIFLCACTTRSTALHCWPVHCCQPHI
jgi:hypothetical protein